MPHVRYLLLAGLVAGCAEPLPLQVRDGSGAGDLADLPAEVEEACEILGIVCAPEQDRTWGVVYLDLVDLRPGRDIVLGRTTVRHRCAPEIWVIPEPRHIAHELGHALGLGHARDAHNLMARDVGEDLTDAQYARIERGADHVVGCRP